MSSGVTVPAPPGSLRSEIDPLTDLIGLDRWPGDLGDADDDPAVVDRIGRGEDPAGKVTEVGDGGLPVAGGGELGACDREKAGGAGEGPGSAGHERVVVAGWNPTVRAKGGRAR